MFEACRTRAAGNRPRNAPSDCRRALEYDRCDLSQRSVEESHARQAHRCRLANSRTCRGLARVCRTCTLFDPSDGKVLYAEDADNQWHPASLTKIMTAYLTFEAIKEGKLTLDQKTSGQPELATQQPPSKLGVAVGAQDHWSKGALKAVIIKSANDVSVDAGRSRQPAPTSSSSPR